MQLRSENIILSKGKLAGQNFLLHDRIYYRIEHLSTSGRRSRGGNSFVFKLINPNDEQEYVIKFSRYALEDSINENIRFEREIDALCEAKKKGFINVVEIMFSGQKKIGGKTFPFYVMEKADKDLRSFILENQISTSQKILLCYELIKGIKELHSIDIYHRDLKPDNVFVINNEGKIKWKIGDLGLIAYRNEDLSRVEYQKKIGPTGWLSPEAMNKVLCEGTKYEYINDCVIDTHSDIFQLGKVFWFIFKFCVPIGQINYSDFQIKNAELFAAIVKMLQYKKSRRSDLEYFEDEFMELAS
jgi:serine/threonine protein kinase